MIRESSAYDGFLQRTESLLYVYQIEDFFGLR